MKKVIAVIVVLLIIGAGYFGFQQYKKAEEVKKITSFDACAAARFPVMDSYPGRCVTPDGRSFTQEIGNELEFTDLITVSNPRPNQKIISPLKITGQARGTWYFEATFPFELFDANGKSLAKGFVTANGEWMTENFVPFSGDITFARPQTKTGKLVIQNANPSGLQENQKTLEMPVSFE
jgi:hypothetical protein